MNQKGNGVLVAVMLVLAAPWATAQEQQEASVQTAPEPVVGNVVDRRLSSDANALTNPFVITQHHANFLLPISYQTNPNQLGSDGFTQDNIEHLESRFQISVKMPVYQLDGGHPLEGLYFGFTALSHWQVYNDEISKPFRETNYEPELFYTFQTDLSLLGYRFNLAQIGLNHQSNGQNQLRSRSWNRLIGTLLFSDEESLYYLRAWYRFKEDRKADPLDPRGDDNPDITHYLGHFELGYGTRLGPFNLITQFRNNLKTRDNKGSIQLHLSYPLSSRYELLLQYFNGYGDSLIDYNRHQQRMSVGIQLTYF